MKRWPIERRWHIITKNAPSSRDVSTHELAHHPAVCLLGAGGLGKTTELAILAEHDRQSGFEVVSLRLAEAGPTGDALERRLKALSARLNERTVLYLDALDEVMRGVNYSRRLTTTISAGEGVSKGVSPTTWRLSVVVVGRSVAVKDMSAGAPAGA